MIGIYKITNTVNSKAYIGESMDIEKRWEKHKEDLNNNSHHSYKLQQDWNEYGENCFIFEVIKELEKSNNIYNTKIDLLLAENKYIVKYNTLVEGYNIKDTIYEILYNNKIILSTHDKNNIINKLMFQKDFFTKYILKSIIKSIQVLDDNKDYSIKKIFTNMPYVQCEKLLSFSNKLLTINGVKLNEKGKIETINKIGLLQIIKFIIKDLYNHKSLFRQSEIMRRYKSVNNIK